MLQSFEKNTQGIDYVVGDLHGAYQLLMEKLKEVSFDFKKDRLFAVGDLIDRGEESLKCALLLTEPWFFSVRGNHEQMMIDAFDNPDDEAEIWISNGGDWIIDHGTETLEDVVDLFRKLPIVINIDTGKGIAGVIHADIPSNIAWNEFTDQIASELGAGRLTNRALWGRSMATRAIKGNELPIIEGVSKVYLGHTIIDDGSPIQSGNLEFLDTGGFMGNLTLKKIEVTDV